MILENTLQERNRVLSAFRSVCGAVQLISTYPFRNRMIGSGYIILFKFSFSALLPPALYLVDNSSLACEYVPFQAVTFGLYLKLREEEIRVSSAIFLRLSYGCLG